MSLEPLSCAAAEQSCSPSETDSSTDSNPRTTDVTPPSSGPRIDTCHGYDSRTESKGTTGYKRKSYRSSPEPDVSTSKKSKLATYDSLCSLCREICFDEITNIAVDALQFGGTSGVPIASFKPRRHEIPSYDCNLCHLLYAHVERSGYKEETYQLSAFSYVSITKTMGFRPEKKIRRADITCLRIAGTELEDFVFCLKRSDRRRHVVMPRILKPKIDMAVCKEWVDYCKENHKLCNHTGTLPSHLRLIDCQSAKVITAPPQSSYVALSYVWGSRPQNHAPLFSRTVRDAIQVAKDLGYRYLWVDRHCVSQENENDKHYQIRQMDLIYRAADLTIIAAAGSDADAGLPGVLDTMRNTQHVVELEDFVVINSMPHPHDAILKSKWSTRAWTLQEAVLSRRRLVFTLDQMYFECGAMNCCESLLENRRLLHTKSKERKAWCYHSGIFSGRYPFDPVLPAKNVEQDISLLQQLIGQYSKRSLSYEQDSFNAFEGIYKYFSRSYSKAGDVQEDLTHIGGIPLVTKRRAGKLVGTMLLFFWQHFRKQDLVPTRRKAFPSWSWIGWSGEVFFDRGRVGWSGEGFFDRWRLVNFEKKIWLEYEHSGTLCLQLKELLLNHQSSGWDHFCQPQALHIPAKFVDTAQLRIESPARFQYGNSSRGYLDWSVPQNNRADVVARFANQEYEIIGIEVTTAPIHRYFVVERHHDFYSRVGEASEFSHYFPLPFKTGQQMVRLR